MSARLYCSKIQTRRREGERERGEETWEGKGASSARIHRRKFEWKVWRDVSVATPDTIACYGTMVGVG